MFSLTFVVVLVFHILHIANAAACSEKLSSAKCAVKNCKWIQVSTGSCSIPASSNCMMDKCTGGVGCVYIPKAGTCEDTVGQICETKKNEGECVGDCTWNNESVGGMCVNPGLVCSYDENDTCLNQNGDPSGCTNSEVYFGCDHNFFYNDNYCSKILLDYGECMIYGCKMQGEKCVAKSPGEHCNYLGQLSTECECLSLGDCKVVQNKCEPIEDVDFCGELSVNPIECCEIFDNGWCLKQNGKCEFNSTQTLYKCKDNADGTECDLDSYKSKQCANFKDSPCRRISDQCVENADGTGCDSDSVNIQLCTWNPTPPFCDVSGTLKNCGAPTSEGNCAVDGCSFVLSTPAECIPDSSLSCGSNVAPCSADQVLNGCKSTAEVGICVAYSSSVVVVMPFFLFIVIALMFYL